jgi:predicted TIM-barrel fold metal-dependent hydrolase
MTLAPRTALAALRAAVSTLVIATGGPMLAQEVTVKDYEPRSTLVVQEHPLTRARFPFIDVHGHLRDLSASGVDRMVEEMDALNLRTIVNLSGGSGDRLRSGLAATRGRYPGRFVAFATPSYEGIDDPGYAERTADQFEKDVRENGAVGLKIFKNLGMFAQDRAGNRIHTDDPRLDPLWRRAGQLRVPVLIHTGEPSPFWLPWDRFNERWLELAEFPDRRRDDPRFASFEETMAEQHRMFRKHPETTFIAAHLGWLGNDLGRLGKLLDELPNVNVELGAVLAELGRQPRTARDFIVRYQDRVMMGKDGPVEPTEYHVYFRVLETADEYFDYYRRRHANWKMYGLDLPDAVLRKVYYQNALRIVGGIDRSGFPPVSPPPS